jgi:tetratricopeptide (TPR) repeat protein
VLDRVVHRQLARFIALAIVVASHVARADVSPADASRASALFEQGRKELTARHVDAACDAFAASFGLDPQPGTRLNLAACRAHQDRLTEAFVLFEQALADAESTGKQGRSTNAAARAAQKCDEAGSCPTGSSTGCGSPRVW